MILPKETQSLWRHIDLGILGCVMKSIAHRSREKIPPIWDSSEVLGPILGSPYKKGKDTLSWVQQRTMNMIKRLEHLVYKKAESWTAQSEQESGKISFLTVCKYLLGVQLKY